MTLTIEQVEDTEGTHHGVGDVTGFWARIRGLPKSVCRDDSEREGWDDADQGIKAGEWDEEPQTSPNQMEKT